MLSFWSNAFLCKRFTKLLFLLLQTGVESRKLWPDFGRHAFDFDRCLFAWALFLPLTLNKRFTILCTIYVVHTQAPNRRWKFSNENINSSFGSYLSQCVALRLIFFFLLVGRLNNFRGLLKYLYLCYGNVFVHKCVCVGFFYDFVHSHHNALDLYGLSNVISMVNMSPFHFGLMHKRVSIHFNC